MSATSQAFKYPQCKKGEYHTGEALSLVCIEPKCIQNSIICGICYNEDHKNHKIKPLKIIINNSRKYLQQLTPIDIDGKQVKEKINEQKKSILAKYDEFEKFVTDSISNIKQSINAVYIKITQKIDLKTGSKEQLIKTLDQIKQQQLQNDKFVSLMTKLLAGVPLQNQQEQLDVNSKQIEDSIAAITKKIEKGLQTKTQTVKKQITNFSELLKKLASNPGLFDPHIQFKFSNQLKHNGVQVVSDKNIKSIQAYNYHFGLMEPAVNEKGSKSVKVAFQIKQNSSNWVAVGLCHKSVVQANNYQFNYSTLGHGGYLISSNGGSWSSIDSGKNNVVTSFNFAKDDIIILNYNPDDGKVVFSKKDTDQSHTLDIQNKEDDDLHLCCLFYYSNDQIEFLGNYDGA